MALSSWTLDQVFNQLNSGTKWSGTTITYAFPTLLSGMYAPNGEGGFTGLNTSQQAVAQLALRLWDDVMAPSFSKVNPSTNPSNTNIEIGYGTAGVDYAHAYFPNDGSVWFNSSFNSGGNDLVHPTIGKHGFLTFVHELGHAIGLDHMGNYNGANNNGPSNFYDSTVYSVMSYYGPSWQDGEGSVAWADWTGADGNLYSPQAPMINDIMAVQRIYGADMTTRSGDTVYGFNTNITDTTRSIYDFTANTNPILCIWDGAGNDTLDLSGWSTRSEINLAPGSFSHGNSMTYNISIAYNCNIENAKGGSAGDTVNGNTLANILTGNGGDDTLNGLSGNDTLIGGLGRDAINGGDGTDTAVFGSAWSAITFSYNSVTKTLTVNDGQFGIDTITGVETFRDFAGVTKSFADLTGTVGAPSVGFAASTASVQEGDAGSTMVSLTVTLSKAATTTQTVNWAAAGSGAAPAGGSDLSGALAGTLSFAAGETSKTIQISVVGDTFAESNETFTVSLSGASGGLALGQSTLVVTIQDDDTSSVVSEIYGTNRANTLFGTSGDDYIDGRRGADSLFGLNGSDTLVGATGADRLDGGTGDDTLFGGTGSDRFIFAQDTGDDIVSDYNDLYDYIDLSQTSILDFTDLTTNHLTFIGNDAVITFGTSSVTITNYTIDNLSSSDFII